MCSSASESPTASLEDSSSNIEVVGGGTIGNLAGFFALFGLSVAFVFAGMAEREGGLAFGGLETSLALASTDMVSIGWSVG